MALSEKITPAIGCLNLAADSVRDSHLEQFVRVLASF
jgi:hypothetical protein